LGVSRWRGVGARQCRGWRCVASPRGNHYAVAVPPSDRRTAADPSPDARRDSRPSGDQCRAASEAHSANHRSSAWAGAAASRLIRGIPARRFLPARVSSVSRDRSIAVAKPRYRCNARQLQFESSQRSPPKSEIKEVVERMSRRVEDNVHTDKGVRTWAKYQKRKRSASRQSSHHWAASAERRPADGRRGIESPTHPTRHWWGATRTGSARGGTPGDRARSRGWRRSTAHHESGGWWWRTRISGCSDRQRNPGRPRNDLDRIQASLVRREFRRLRSLKAYWGLRRALRGRLDRRRRLRQ